MFNKTIARVKGWLTKMGIIKSLEKLTDHKKIVVNEEIYNRIAKNKAIYQGFLSEWHTVTEKSSVTGDTFERNMLTFGMGKVLPEEMAKLIFNEKAKIDVSVKDDEGSSKVASDFIMDVLKNNGFHKNFQRYLEYGYALGGMAVKVYVYEGKIKLAYAVADAFYPLGNDSENIDEALFINEEFKNGKYYTLLEWNEWEGDLYRVTNELYQSEVEGELGVNVPLSVLYEDFEPVVYMKKISRPLFTYFKLNTANNKDLTSPLGVSLFENSYDTLYMLDFMYDFWFNEFELGRRRIAVDRSMIKPFTDINGNTRTAFDPKETVFTALNGEDLKNVVDLTVELRTQEIIDSINALLDILAMQVGFSTGTFNFDGKSVKTATEIVSENSKTYQTKNSHETLVEEGIKELITSIVDIGLLYELYTGSANLEIDIDFDDSIAQDRQENFNYYSSAASQGLMPKEIAIQRIHSVTKETALEWIEMMDKESAINVDANATDLFGIGATNIGRD